MTLQSLYKIIPTANGFLQSRRTSSVYGISEEKTSNRYTPIPPHDARNHPRQRSRKTLRRGDHNLELHGIKFIYARSKGCPPLGPNRKHPCPIQGHGTLIPASPLGVYQENDLQLTMPYSFQKTCDSIGWNEWECELCHDDTEVK